MKKNRNRLFVLKDSFHHKTILNKTFLTEASDSKSLARVSYYRDSESQSVTPSVYFRQNSSVFNKWQPLRRVDVVRWFLSPAVLVLALRHEKVAFHQNVYVSRVLFQKCTFYFYFFIFKDAFYFVRCFPLGFSVQQKSSDRSTPALMGHCTHA